MNEAECWQGLSTVSEENRKKQLDGLRCIAVLLVYFGHTYGLYFGYDREWTSTLGVRLFFVLSGFLITRILLRSRTDSIWNDMRTFYTRRFLRIFPLYYLVLTTMFAVGYVSSTLALMFYLYTFNFALAQGIDAGCLDPFWTLCVEEQFYLLCPLLVWKTPKRYLPYVLCALLLASTAIAFCLDHGAQLYAALHLRPMFSAPRCLLVCSAPFLLWGCLSAYLDFEHEQWIRPTLAVFLGLGLMAACAILYFSGLHDLVILQGPALALLITGLDRTSNRNLKAPLQWAPVAYIGLISYGIYVYHEIVFVVTVNIAKAFPLLGQIPGPVLALLLTLTLASLSWHMFEQPANRMKRYFPYKGVQPVAPLPVGTS